ncbi:hypothetical protein [Halostella salina]|uniref:hypothetical protein n=1 Tax=Halostella salina TaxID=1547897 RepID=UPI000EF7D1CD|nr:hypothetical protein [Halostella salina]
MTRFNPDPPTVDLGPPVVVPEAVAEHTKDGNGAVVIGNGATGDGYDPVAIGDGMVAGQQAVGIGPASDATGTKSVAIGNSAWAKPSGAVAIGSSTTTDGADATGVGISAEADADGSVAIGKASSVFGNSPHGFEPAPDGIAIGSGSEVTKGATEAIAIGSGTTVGTPGLARIGADQLVFGGTRDTVTDSNLQNGELTVEMDESAGAFRLRGKDSNGNVREATVPW